jgi:threonine/homoserine/homoserine lactone efflux protein
LAIFAAAIFAKLKQRKTVSNYIHKICGIALITLGIKVAFFSEK